MLQAQKSHPFRAEPPRILHYRKCPTPPPKGGKTTELESAYEVTKELCDLGWALQRVKEYPTKQFDIGEERLGIANLVQVSGDMRKARETVGERRCERSERLTKAQV